MEYQIKVSEEAEKDLIIARCHYKISNQEKVFDNDFTNQVKFLKVNPFLFQIYYRSIRKVHLKQFKYSIHFSITKNIVYIFRILHHKQISN
jgi:hypothetical protein